MFAWVAQLVEHSPEERRVSSSSLLPSTYNRPRHVRVGVVAICSLGAGSKAGSPCEFRSVAEKEGAETGSRARLKGAACDRACLVTCAK